MLRSRRASSTTATTPSPTPSLISPSAAFQYGHQPMQPEDLHFGDNVLIAAVAQHHQSGQVLMLGYANREAIERTLASGVAWFYSRSRQALWQKGETSGNVLTIKGVRIDCDADAVIYLCEPHGPTCHTGEPSCFFQTLDELPAGETDGEAASALSARSVSASTRTRRNPM